MLKPTMHIYTLTYKIWWRKGEVGRELCWSALFEPPYKGSSF
jgi:hypothetical protein